MSQQTNISIRIDKDLKKQFEGLCDELGLTMSSLINVFIKKTVRYQGLPFALSINDYNKETQKAVEEVENGIGLSKVYENIDEMFEDLNA